MHEKIRNAKREAGGKNNLVPDLDAKVSNVFWHNFLPFTKPL